MKSLIFLFFITAIFGTSVYAQNTKPKIAALPDGIAGWKGDDSDKILDDPVIKIRLKKLMGKNNYAAFLESFETLAPIEKNGDVLFASGCLIHACGHLESAIAIDTVNNTVHAAIYRENEKTRYFNEKVGKTPDVITVWARRLSEPGNNEQKNERNNKRKNERK